MQTHRQPWRTDSREPSRSTKRPSRAGMILRNVTCWRRIPAVASLKTSLKWPDSAERNSSRHHSSFQSNRWAASKAAAASLLREAVRTTSWSWTPPTRTRRIRRVAHLRTLPLAAGSPPPPTTRTTCSRQRLFLQRVVPTTGNRSPKHPRTSSRPILPQWAVRW